MSKLTLTVRLPKYKVMIIRAIARHENRSLVDIYNELTDGYIKSHRETLELLNIPGLPEGCRSGLEEIRAGKGKVLIELEDQDIDKG